MPTGTPASDHIHWQPIKQLLQHKAGKRQALVGFDDEFNGIVDYIIKITHRIWEEKNTGLCYRYYADPCPVHTLGGYSDSVEDVVQGTLKTIAAFPDRILIGENVVWSAEDKETWYSSHRITSAMTQSGPSEFGPATGATGRVTTIADCVCRGNRVVYEWLMRDNSFLVKQLGLDPVTVAGFMARNDQGDEFRNWWQSEFERVTSTQVGEPGVSPGIPNDAESFATWWVNTLFNQKMFGEVSRLYRPNAHVEWPGGRHVIGLRGISGTLIQWLAQFPDARATCDHVAVTPFNDQVTDIAIRWSLAGHFNSRDTQLEEFNGQPSLVMAATHLRVIEGQIAQEWTVFDELALITNLMRAKANEW